MKDNTDTTKQTAKQKSTNVTLATLEFSKKLKAFNLAQQKQVAPFVEATSNLASLILEKDQAFFMQVLSTYSQFKSPYKTLGKDSIAAKTIIKDQEHIFACYNLYKAALACQKQFAKNGTTYITDFITTPLLQDAKYTTGGSLIYLQAWLYFEKKAHDFVPVFLQRTPQKYFLHFTPYKELRLPYKQKEIWAAIQSFYKTPCVFNKLPL